MWTVNVAGFWLIKAWHHVLNGRLRLVTCQRSGDLFLFGLVWQYSSNQNQYNKGIFKFMATVSAL